jgi:hypothetical protein
MGQYTDQIIGFIGCGVIFLFAYVWAAIDERLTTRKNGKYNK